MPFLRLAFMERALNIFLIITLLALTSSGAYSQNYPRSRFEVSGGAGWPEMGHVKLKYGENFQVGISQGVTMNTAIEFYYHFAGESHWTDRKTWYGLTGVEYLYWNKGKNIFPFLRFGKELNMNRRYGVKLDIGIFYLVEDDDFFSTSRVSPSGSVGFFLRI